MTATTKLALELLQNNAANQTLANTTFAQLNQLVQAAVVDRTNTPPGSPANEALYIITATATGAWAGKENQLAYWLTSTNAWQYVLPREGMLVHVNDEDVYYKYNGTAWEILATGGGSSTIATQSASSVAGALDLSATTAPVILVTLTENITSITLPAGAANQSIERRIVFTQGGAGTYTIPVTTGAWGSIVVDGGGAIQQMGTGVGTVGVYVLANDNNGTWRMYIDDSRRTSPYATAGGTANAITLSINHVPSRLTAYAQGDKVRARIGTTNTGATTLAVDGLSAVSVVTITGAALPAGYIRTDVDTEFTYNGSAWVADRLVERGSNANGYFVRHANGVLECWATGLSTDINVAMGSLFRGFFNWTLPASYSSTTGMRGESTASSQNDMWGGNALVSSASVLVLRAFSAVTRTGVTIEGYCIGFWY